MLGLSVITPIIIKKLTKKINIFSFLRLIYVIYLLSYVVYLLNMLLKYLIYKTRINLADLALAKPSLLNGALWLIVHGGPLLFTFICCNQGIFAITKYLVINVFCLID